MRLNLPMMIHYWFKLALSLVTHGVDMALWLHLYSSGRICKTIKAIAYY